MVAPERLQAGCLLRVCHTLRLHSRCVITVQRLRTHLCFASLLRAQHGISGMGSGCLLRLCHSLRLHSRCFVAVRRLRTHLCFASLL